MGQYASGPGGLPLPGGNSVGIACEFTSDNAILAPDVIAWAVKNATENNRRLSVKKSPISLPDNPAVGSVITLNQAISIANDVLSLVGSKNVAVAIVDAGAIPKYTTTSSGKIFSVGIPVIRLE